MTEAAVTCYEADFCLFFCFTAEYTEQADIIFCSCFFKLEYVLNELIRWLERNLLNI